MFYFPRFAPRLREIIEVYSTGLPHSEIPGSSVATHLPEAYRRYAASFIAFWCLGIHHSPLCQPSQCWFNLNADLNFILSLYLYYVLRFSNFSNSFSRKNRLGSSGFPSPKSDGFRPLETLVLSRYSFVRISVYEGPGGCQGPNAAPK